MDVRGLALPIVQAPLAGGPSTPRLAAAVAEAGGLGFLAAGYRTPGPLEDDIRELRALSAKPFGVNLFAPPGEPPDREGVESYAERLQAEAARFGVELGRPTHDDDHFEAKLEVVSRAQVDIVSFTFGGPSREAVERLHEAGSDVWVTVTSPAEAVEAASVGADALVVQGFEAGGHRGYFIDGPEAQDYGLLALLRLVAARVELPLIAAGGIADGASVAAVLCAGAAAAQLGTALMLAPEAGTAAAIRSALRGSRPTELTRAFSGRRARGIVNRFMEQHGPYSPIAYPDVHHLTTPIRAAARENGDPEAVNLWAGQAYPLLREAPAGEIVRRIAEEARAVIASLADGGG